MGHKHKHRATKRSSVEQETFLNLQTEIDIPFANKITRFMLILNMHKKDDNSQRGLQLHQGET